MLETLERDVDFLRVNRLMDYSLFLVKFSKTDDVVNRVSIVSDAESEVKEVKQGRLSDIPRASFLSHLDDS